MRKSALVTWSDKPAPFTWPQELTLDEYEQQRREKMAQIVAERQAAAREASGDLEA